MSLGFDLRSKAITKQINSPHAKYNSRGKLMCIVCGVEVKSAIIWKAHVNKRSHLENLENLQKKQQKLNNLHKKPPNYGKAASASNTKKRPTEGQNSPSKKAKGVGSKEPPKPPKGILKNLISYDSDESDEEDIKPDLNLIQNSNITDDKSKVKDNLPDGFFDQDVKLGETDVKPKIESLKEPWKREPSPEPIRIPKPNTSEVLPEGFFDDPVADAKARNVEYKDKEAEEWMTFMKEVSAAELESRQIIAEDKEEAAIENQLEDANEQLNHLQKVVDLDKKKNDILNSLDKGNDDDDSSSDEEFSPVIWRTKNSFI